MGLLPRSTLHYTVRSTRSRSTSLRYFTNALYFILTSLAVPKACVARYPPVSITLQSCHCLFCPVHRTLFQLLLLLGYVNLSISSCLSSLYNYPSGMLCCIREQWFFASLLFALAGMFRSNGILLAGFIIWGLLVRPFLDREKVILFGHPPNTSNLPPVSYTLEHS